MTYTLFSDGSRFPKINKSGFGGYIQDSNSVVLVEFTQEIKQEDQKHNFELHGIITGVELALQMQIKDIVCKCDDKTLMLHMNECVKNPQHLKRILGNKKELFEKLLSYCKDFNSIVFEYVPRNSNKYSDSLSRKYVRVLQKSFYQEQKNHINRSKDYFLTSTTPTSSVFFHSPKALVVPFENDPFLISQQKNKKQKDFRLSLAGHNFEHWSVDGVFTQDRSLKLKTAQCIVLKKYNPQTQEWQMHEEFMLSKKAAKISLYDAIEAFKESLAIIHAKSESGEVWVSSNMEAMVDILYKRKPLSKEIFPKFLELSKYCDNFKTIIFHRCPKEIEMAVKRKKTPKVALRDFEQTIALIEQCPAIEQKYKYFGQLMSMVLKSINTSTGQTVAQEDKKALKDQLLKKHGLSLGQKLR